VPLELVLPRTGRDPAQAAALRKSPEPMSGSHPLAKRVGA
jgi:hypothetical protein